jgi:hypothetical protein
MFQKEQWLEVGAMELDLNEDLKLVQIAAIEVDQLLPEARERSKEKARLDKKYTEICMQVSSGGNVDKDCSISKEILGRKNRINVPEGL